MRFEVRVGRQGDADGIADVHTSSWRAGYGHVLPESVLYADDFDASRRSYWHDWRFAPGHRLLVATTTPDDDRDGRVVGFASYGPERERARGFTGRGEIWALYTHPIVWGTGVADELIVHTEERLQAEGFEQAVLWVLDDNPRARRFYERHGWAPTGIEGDFDADVDLPLPELEYRKEF